MTITSGACWNISDCSVAGALHGREVSRGEDGSASVAETEASRN